MKIPWNFRFTAHLQPSVRPCSGVRRAASRRGVYLPWPPSAGAGGFRGGYNTPHSHTNRHSVIGSMVLVLGGMLFLGMSDLCPSLRSCFVSPAGGAGRPVFAVTGRAATSPPCTLVRGYQPRWSNAIQGSMNGFIQLLHWFQDRWC